MDPEQLMVLQGGWLRARVYVLVLLIADIDITCASCTDAVYNLLWSPCYPLSYLYLTKVFPSIYPEYRKVIKNL